eukprot:962758-Rhodomonas_salina.1
MPEATLHTTVVLDCHSVPSHADPPTRPPADASHEPTPLPATTISPIRAAGQLPPWTDDSMDPSKEWRGRDEPACKATVTARIAEDPVPAARRQT